MTCGRPGTGSTNDARDDTSRDGVTIVQSRGRARQADERCGARRARARSVGGNDVLVDLSTVEFLDSAGLHMLFRLARATSRTGGRLAMVIPTASPVRRLVEIANVDGIAAVCDSVEEGIARMRKRLRRGGHGFRS